MINSFCNHVDSFHYFQRPTSGVRHEHLMFGYFIVVKWIFKRGLYLTFQLLPNNCWY
jgi:hypothetical protein